MIRFIILIVLTILSIGCKASTCFISEVSINEDSTKYSQLIDITVSKSGQSNLVIVTAPSTISGLTLVGIMLHKRSLKDKDDILSVPLLATFENEKVSSWYSADENLIQGNVITIDYGKNCGISLRYNVN